MARTYHGRAEHGVRPLSFTDGPARRRSGEYGELMNTTEPTRAEIDATPGETVLEFGATWCGFCQAAKPHVAAALGERPTAQHRWVEDGPGKPLGRSYRVKLWPTLVVLRDGREVARVVRPNSVAEIRAALAHLSDPG
jgi:thioredoxin 1